MTESLPPNPPLLEYYGDAAKRERFVRDIFDDTAPWYDDILGLVSFGSESRYRRQALARAGLKDGMRLLDLATGTGAVARAASTMTKNIIGADASIGMLLAGRAKQRFPLLLAKGERLPLRDASFDMLTTGYALRHFADLHTLFGECRRVLKPGGRLLILEITPPRSHFGRAALRLHMDGLKDAYMVEGGIFQKWDAAKQTYVNQGSVINLDGKAKLCSWDQSVSTCK